MGPGIPPVAPKLVAAIVSGEFIDLVSLLEDHTQLEAQFFSLVADLFIIRPAKRQTITHILSWMQPFSVYMLVVTASYPARVSDLLKYQLLIMCTAQQLSGSAIEIIDRLPSTHSRSIISMGSAWVSYDRASRRQAAAYKLNDSMVTNKSRTISFLRTRPCFGRTTHSCPPPPLRSVSLKELSRDVEVVEASDTSSASSFATLAWSGWVYLCKHWSSNSCQP